MSKSNFENKYSEPNNICKNRRPLFNDLSNRNTFLGHPVDRACVLVTQDSPGMFKVCYINKSLI